MKEWLRYFYTDLMSILTTKFSKNIFLLTDDFYFQNTLGQKSPYPQNSFKTDHELTGAKYYF